MNLSESIKYFRKQAGLSQKQLAEKTKLSIASIQGYEQGKYKPKLEAQKKIAHALNIPVSKLNEELYVTEDFGSIENHTRLAHNLIDDLHNIKTNKLLEIFELLNKNGQDKAIEQLELLSKIPEYCNRQI